MALDAQLLIAIRLITAEFANRRIGVFYGKKGKFFTGIIGNFEQSGVHYIKFTFTRGGHISRRIRGGVATNWRFAKSKKDRTRAVSSVEMVGKY